MTFFENLRGIFGGSQSSATDNESAEALRARLAAQVIARNKEIEERTTGRLTIARADLTALNDLAKTDPLVMALTEWCRLSGRVLFLGDQYIHPRSDAKSSIVLSAEGFRVAWCSAMAREYGQDEYPCESQDLMEITERDLVSANLSLKGVIAELYAYAKKIGKRLPAPPPETKSAPKPVAAEPRQRNESLLD